MKHFILLSIFVLYGIVCANASQTWHIVVSQTSEEDEAIRVALEDLRTTGRECGIEFLIFDDRAEPDGDAILVGGTERNQLTSALQNSGAIQLSITDNPEGYEIVTIATERGKRMTVNGGSLIGDVRGLYWIWDRIRVFKSLIDINTKREPALPIRYTRVAVHNEAGIRRALRYGLNLVYGENPLNLILWDTEPEHTENEKHRARTRELAAYAHKLHMKFLAFGTEFTYHPCLLEKHGASLTPTDPQFWDAVRDKYRMLFQTMPELDGVGTFLGEEQQYWGEYRTFDPIHEGEDCDWSLEKRYRIFVKTVAEVVCGEFNKLLLHRTWNTNAIEQQSQPAIYQRTFTDEIPTKNLYLIPSFTQNDRWWFQAYNPTVNLTPHDMMVVLESMDYHAGGNVFPTFPGQYYQAGLQTMLDAGLSNLKGASFDLYDTDDWQAKSVSAYTASRLEWRYQENVQTIAQDFCAIHFGRDAAEGMADIYLLSPVAYKYGLYIEPTVYGQFTSLPHIRVGRFVIQGYSKIDGGKEHVEFLRKIYLRCKPWLHETVMYLDHGLETANRMTAMYQEVKPRIEDRNLAETVEASLLNTKFLIQTNNLYAKTIFAYFEYCENPTAEKRSELDERVCALKATCDAFEAVPGYGYHLYGVRQMLENANAALADLPRAKQALKEAPTPEQIEKLIAKQQQRYREVLEECKDQARQIVHWECRVDGRDLMKVCGDRIEIEHLRWDQMYFKDYKILEPLPSQAVTVVPKDIESRPLHPFVLEQPTEENGYTATIYLYDVPGGAGWCKFDLYYIPKSPAELGLEIKW